MTDRTVGMHWIVVGLFYDSCYPTKTLLHKLTPTKTLAKATSFWVRVSAHGAKGRVSGQGATLDCGPGAMGSG